MAQTLSTVYLEIRRMKLHNAAAIVSLVDLNANVLPENMLVHNLLTS